jgi:hypothetical protein
LSQVSAGAVERLKQLYKKDRIARVMLDSFATYQRNRTTMKVDHLLLKLRNMDSEVTRADIVRILKELEILGFGRYVLGRWSHPSRFQWAASVAEVGKAASGEETTVQQLPESSGEVSDEEPDLLAHSFQLRPELQITIELPSDLTRTEAARLAKFIESLPFDGADVAPSS